MPIISPIQQQLLQSPLLPKSEPPPLPKSEPPMLFKSNSENQQAFCCAEKPQINSLEELSINKAILDNIKVIDNWKHEQEILMRVNINIVLLIQFTLSIFFYYFYSKNMKKNKIELNYHLKLT